MFTRAQFEHEMEAVDAADACISAACVGADYASRLIPYQDDFVAIAEYFWDRCPITRKRLVRPGHDTRDVARVFLTLSNGERVNGFQAKLMSATLERVRRKLKGKKLGARLMMLDSKAKGNCDAPSSHTQPCQCHALNLYRLAEREAGNE